MGTFKILFSKKNFIEIFIIVFMTEIMIISSELVFAILLSLLNNLGKAPVEQPESEIVIDAEVNEND